MLAAAMLGAALGGAPPRSSGVLLVGAGAPVTVLAPVVCGRVVAAGVPATVNASRRTGAGGTIATAVTGIARGDTVLADDFARIDTRAYLGAPLTDALDAWARRTARARVSTRGRSTRDVRDRRWEAADALEGLASSLRDRGAVAAEAAALSAQARSRPSSWRSPGRSTWHGRRSPIATHSTRSTGTPVGTCVRGRRRRPRAARHPLDAADPARRELSVIGVLALAWGVLAALPFVGGARRRQVAARTEPYAPPRPSPLARIVGRVRRVTLPPPVVTVVKVVRAPARHRRARRRDDELAPSSPSRSISSVSAWRRDQPHTSRWSSGRGRAPPQMARARSTTSCGRARWVSRSTTPSASSVFASRRARVDRCAAYRARGSARRWPRRCRGSRSTSVPTCGAAPSACAHGAGPVVLPPRRLHPAGVRASHGCARRVRRPAPVTRPPSPHAFPGRVAPAKPGGGCV